MSEPSDEQPVEIRELQGDQLSKDENQESRSSVRSSLRSVFSWHNYAVYLVTSWIFSAFTAIWSLLNLYLRTLDWDFLQIGSVMMIVSVTSAIARIVGGYVGDTIDRKKLSVIAMFMVAASHLTIGLFTDFTMVLFGLMIYAMMDLAKGGSSAYIMDNIPQKDSGLALSLFTAGGSFGVVTLIAFGALVPLVGFGSAMRSTFVVAGLLFFVCTAARARFLTSSRPKVRVTGIPLWKDFLHENRHAVNLLLTIMPGVLVIVILDSLSDAVFGFAALLYANEFLGVSISDITIIVLVPLVVSVPLLLKIGRFSDQRGVKRAAIAVYSVMPVCAVLLMISPAFPYWAPAPFVETAESLMKGLGVVFTTPFLAIVMKNINDTLWMLVLLTLIQKRLPRQDTSKILAVFWFIVYLFTSIGPFIGGILFTYSSPSHLFAVVAIFNVIILASIARTGLVRKDNELTGPTSVIRAAEE